ncbi:alpha-amylase [Escherichia coli]|nr:alpha-amylase [Escherichia coli]
MGLMVFGSIPAKHVELPAWQQLKTEASAALREWKKANPDKALDDKPFWMTGEAWATA